MTLPFQEEIVNDTEYSSYNFEHPNFIGYLNKYGDALDYSRPLGFGGHDNNKLTAFFEYYFRMPTHDAWLQEDKGINIINLKKEKTDAEHTRNYFKDRIEHTADIVRNYGTTQNAFSRFQNDLDLFFYNCYQAKTFMDGFGQNCMMLNEGEFYNQYCKDKEEYRRKDDETEEQYNERINWNFEYDYHWYKKHLMLDWYKTVIVQYMHYHLIERCEKGITTSDSKPYETFYNYLLNDFKIHQIPRMVFDSENKMYVPYSQSKFLIPDSELRLQEEIQAIKKLVPLEERPKYYR